MPESTQAIAANGAGAVAAPAPAPAPARKRLIVAITGATGAVYGVRLLQFLRSSNAIETHLMISEAGCLSLHQELGMKRRELEALADHSYAINDVGAAPASGSFQCEGMVVAPCSMKTLAAIAHGLSDNLVTRAGDVVLKERRRLVLMVREAPLNLAHLRNMTAVTEMGGIIYPPVPAFYQHPQNIEQMIDHTLGRVLDLFGLPQELAPPWLGMLGKSN
ncbi:MAG: hypothetical protein RL748_1170 [Pseudomonadota bacterium]